METSATRKLGITQVNIRNEMLRLERSAQASEDFIGFMEKTGAFIGNMCLNVKKLLRKTTHHKSKQ